MFIAAAAWKEQSWLGRCKHDVSNKFARKKIPLSGASGRGGSAGSSAAAARRTRNSSFVAAHIGRFREVFEPRQTDGYKFGQETSP